MNCRFVHPGSTAAALAVPLVAAAFFAAGAAPACAEEAHFAGKTVRMIVGSNAGGVTDVGARLVARFMGKLLPDSPSIVVQNVPGANGIAATNMFYLRSAPDGMTSLAGSSSQVTPDVIRANPSVQYDLKKFVWIGGVYNQGTLVVVSKDGAERLRTGKGEPVTMGQVGGARTEALVAVWAAEYIGWRVRFITGYVGTPEIGLALRKGEIDMMNSSSVSGMEDLLKDKGAFEIIMQTGVAKNGKMSRRDGFEQIPTISESIAGKISGPATSAFASWLDSIQIGKYFALPPNTPEAYAKAYQVAYLKMNDDPDFKKQADQAFEPDYVLMTSNEIKVLVDRMAATHEADYLYVDKLREKYHLAAREGAANAAGAGSKSGAAKAGDATK